MTMIKLLTRACALALPLLLLLFIFSGCKNNAEKQSLELDGNLFEVQSWNEFPDLIKYKLYYVEGSKKEQILEGVTEDQLPDFKNVVVSNGVVFAQYHVSYLRVSEGSVDVFSWTGIDEQHELFIDYFHWLIKNEVYLDCINVSIALFKYNKDDVALSFLEKFISEGDEGAYEGLNASELHSLRIRKDSAKELLENING